jgi:hypothetical protein
MLADMRGDGEVYWTEVANDLVEPATSPNVTYIDDVTRIHMGVVAVLAPEVRRRGVVHKVNMLTALGQQGLIQGSEFQRSAFGTEPRQKVGLAPCAPAKELVAGLGGRAWDDPIANATGDRSAPLAGRNLEPEGVKSVSDPGAAKIFPELAGHGRSDQFNPGIDVDLNGAWREIVGPPAHRAPGRHVNGSDKRGLKTGQL